MKQLARSLFRVRPNKQTFAFSCKNPIYFNSKNTLFKSHCNFSTKLTPENIPGQNLAIVHEQVKIGEAELDAFQTKGSISVLDQVKGAKRSDSGELYALMFTCGQCNTKAIRSFTKNAYHKGVVMVKCQGCEVIHLVADNLGWFEDNPSNLDTLGEGKVQKVNDPVAISKFLKVAFGDQPNAQKGIQSQQKEEKDDKK